jgi:chromosomal replication initiator protein
MTINDIIERVAAKYELTPKKMLAPRKDRAVAWPRQVAMYFARKITKASYSDIGRAFYGREHATVMHAVNKVEHLLDESATWASNVAVERYPCDVVRELKKEFGL